MLQNSDWQRNDKVINSIKQIENKIYNNDIYAQLFFW